MVSSNLEDHEFGEFTAVFLEVVLSQQAVSLGGQLFAHHIILLKALLRTTGADLGVCVLGQRCPFA